MKALQATKVLAHYKHTVEKHALQSSNTTTRPIAQEGVQNRHRDIDTQAWGKIPENTITLSLPQKVSMKSVVFSREVTGDAMLYSTHGSSALQIKCNQTQKGTHTTSYSMHYEASIQRRLFYVLRGPSPKGIVSNRTQSIYVPYICAFVKAYFDFFLGIITEYK